MVKTIKDYWRIISYSGIQNQENLTADEIKIRIFFNQSIFLGFFTLFAFTINLVPLIGNVAYLNLFTCLAIVLGFISNSLGYFNVAKRIVIYGMFATGIVITLFSGPDFLFHVFFTTILIFSLILFYKKKSYFELTLFILMTFGGYILGELNILEIKGLDLHPDTPVARILNLIIPISIVVLFISFILNLNIQNEKKLNKILLEKDELLKEVLLKTVALEQEGSMLEDEISKRLLELNTQKKLLEIKNQEKEILLKEVHHRVKNNLQIIVSLVSLQSNKFEDEAVLNAFQETQNRIITMALVHQRMYQTTDFVAVEINNYIDLIIENIKLLFENKAPDIHVCNKINAIAKVHIETAIPLGLIINEIITNAFKHAFIDETNQDELRIEITKSDKDLFLLKFHDNGPGFPAGFDIDQSDSLGVQLILALIDQIEGELKYYNDNGAVYEIRFSV
ncbi:sensor histidine kinase [Putridiphycobacter roseus]|nr:sensor histidine kinase [Putridiphycobacter roseus]